MDFLPELYFTKLPPLPVAVFRLTHEGKTASLLTAQAKGV